MRCGVVTGGRAFGTAALLVLTVFAGAGPQSDRYTDAEYHYSVAKPAGWTRKADMTRPFVAFLGPIEQTSFTIYTEPAANRTLAQYVKSSREEFVKNKAFRLQSEGKIRLGGSPAQFFQSLVTVKGHPQATARQIVAVHGGRGYVLTFTVPPPALKKLIPTMNKTVASFRWER